MISGGNFNAFEFSDGYIDTLGTYTNVNVLPSDQVVQPGAAGLVTPSLTNLALTLPATQRWSYVEDGSAQILDHMVVTQDLVAAGVRFAYAHLNADFPLTAYNAETSGTPCGKLFYLTTTSSSTPTDTITAALNIAQHPAQNVAKLNKLRSAAPAFLPAISVNTPPSDWTIAITYSGGGLKHTTGRGHGSNGNVWVANSAGILRGDAHFARPDDSLSD